MSKRKDVPGITLIWTLFVGALALGALAGCTQNASDEDPAPKKGTTGSIGSHAVGVGDGTARTPGGAAPTQKAPDRSGAKPLRPD